MRDQLHGQLYDGWRTDCDVASKPCGFGECRGACDVCHDDDYEHCIIPADTREPYSGYDDDHFPSTEIVVESYRPLSAKYTY